MKVLTFLAIVSVSFFVSFLNLGTHSFAAPIDNEFKEVPCNQSAISREQLPQNTVSFESLPLVLIEKTLTYLHFKEYFLVSRVSKDCHMAHRKLNLYQALNLNKDFIETVSFSPNGSKMITTGEEDTANIWDTITGKLLQTLEGHTRWVRNAQFSPDGTLIVTTSDDNTAILWNAETGKKLHNLSDHTHKILSAQFSPDSSKIVTATKDQAVVTWDVITGDRLLILGGNSRWAEFSPDGTQLLTEFEDETTSPICLWNVTTGEKLRTVKCRNERDPHFSPDGSTIVTLNDQNIFNTWDARTGEHLLRLDKPFYNGKSAQYSPDGTQLLTTSTSGTVFLLNATTGKHLLNQWAKLGRSSSAQFFPDGSKIVFPYQGRRIIFWNWTKHNR